MNVFGVEVGPGWGRMPCPHSWGLPGWPGALGAWLQLWQTLMLVFLNQKRLVLPPRMACAPWDSREWAWRGLGGACPPPHLTPQAFSASLLT